MAWWDPRVGEEKRETTGTICVLRRKIFYSTLISIYIYTVYILCTWVHSL
jgi:hypothetical protein